jgi:hypothetical protein
MAYPPMFIVQMDHFGQPPKAQGEKMTIPISNTPVARSANRCRAGSGKSGWEDSKLTD